jgi:2-amino-4-hydroxy-6-hydroxymethyldihydropteridine diphosphokinase
VPEIYIAAGSNVEPERHLAQAAAALERAFGPVTFSPWYRNGAVGFEGDDFINWVAGFASAAAVREVVATLHAIESECGRPRDAPKWAPRTIDLDMLLYGDLVCDEPGLHLPRPDLLRRPYMLGPLADIAPQLIHPTARVSIGQLWAQFDRAAHPLRPIAPAFTSRGCARRRPPESDP